VGLALECRTLEERMEGGKVRLSLAMREFMLHAYAVGPRSRFIGRGTADLAVATAAARMPLEHVPRRRQSLDSREPRDLSALNNGGVETGLRLSVRALDGGFVCGWLRSLRPGPMLWIVESTGLARFVTVVGLNAGPDVVPGLKSSGPSLVLAGDMKISIPPLIGVCAGVRTTTTALGMIQEAAKSTVPALGYGMPYAIGNALLTNFGMMIVLTLVGESRQNRPSEAHMRSTRPPRRQQWTS
jgi:hypothetical protein